jgi:hypothetical protein
MTTAQIWVAAIGTLAIFSYLYGENPFWRLAEHIYVGLAAAWSVAYQFHSYVKPFVLQDLMEKGSWSLIIPAILGLLIYTRYFPGVSWLARYPLSFWIGYGAGYVLGFTPAVYMEQITASFIKLNHLNALIVLLSLLATLMYFFFTIRRDSPVMQYGASLGRYAIMIGLGANFGSTMLYRFSLFLARVKFLLGDWLHLVS